jgi:hypothetical protein
VHHAFIICPTRTGARTIDEPFMSYQYHPDQIESTSHGQNSTLINMFVKNITQFSLNILAQGDKVNPIGFVENTPRLVVETCNFGNARVSATRLVHENSSPTSVVMRASMCVAISRDGNRSNASQPDQ